LDYADSVCYGISTCNLANSSASRTLLLTLLHTAGRNVRPAHFFLFNLHWLPIKYWMNFKIATLIYKTLVSGQPGYLRNLLSTYKYLVNYAPTCSLRSQDNHLITKPSVYTSIGRRAFSYAAPQIWNAIPLNIRISPSVSSFKCHLKTFYFATAF